MTPAGHSWEVRKPCWAYQASPALASASAFHPVESWVSAPPVYQCIAKWARTAEESGWTGTRCSPPPPMTTAPPPAATMSEYRGRKNWVMNWAPPE